MFLHLNKDNILFIKLLAINRKNKGAPNMVDIIVNGYCVMMLVNRVLDGFYILITDLNITIWNCRLYVTSTNKISTTRTYFAVCLSTLPQLRALDQAIAKSKRHLGHPHWVS